MFFRKNKEHYFSQVGEDDYLDNHVFGGMKYGTFLDIGAHDGVTFSNTYFFEKFRRWSGVCVEPLPDMFEKLQKNRRAQSLNVAISNKSGKLKFLQVTGPGNAEMFSGLVDKYEKKHLDRVHREIKERKGKGKVITVQSMLIQDVISNANLTHIDYCNIDTEGGELEILKTIDFEKIRIDCFTVEDIFGKNTKLLQFMKSKGYRMVKRLDVDVVFVRNDFKLLEKRTPWF